MYELFFEKQPYLDGNRSANNMWYLGLEIANQGLRPTVPEDMMDFTQDEQTYVKVMQQCWQTNAQDRPTFDEIATMLKF
jgi:hypothetical protein